MVTEQEQYEHTIQDQQALQATKGAGAYMSPQDKYGSSIITLTNPENDLYKFELFLRSMRQDHNGELVKIGKSLLNEKGINAMMACIESLVHHMNALSNFDKHAVEFLIVGLTDTMAKDLMLNRLSYQIDRKNRDIVLDNAVRFAYGFVMRAFEEGDRGFWKGSMTEIKHTQQLEKTGGFSLNPFRWGK